MLSFDPPVPATPVVYLLRQVLESSRSYTEALVRLSETPIPCDWPFAFERCASRRTRGDRADTDAVRYAANGAVFVTNDYLSLQAGAPSSSGLAATSCGRRERIEALVRDKHPANAAECLTYLSDAGVKMGITMQQMVFCAATGGIAIASQ